MRKKLRFLCVLSMLLLGVFSLSISHVFALELDSVGEILSQIDLSELENFYNGLDENGKNLLGGSVKDFLTNIVNGNMFKIDGILPYVLSIIGGEAVSILPSFLAIISILLISSLLNGLNPGFASKSINGVITFSSVCIIGALLCFQIIQSVNKCVVFIKAVYSLTQIMFPIIFIIITILKLGLYIINNGPVAVAKKKKK